MRCPGEARIVHGHSVVPSPVSSDVELERLADCDVRTTGFDWRHCDLSAVTTASQTEQWNASDIFTRIKNKDSTEKVFN